MPQSESWLAFISALYCVSSCSGSDLAVSERHLTLNAGNWNCDRRRYPEEKGVGESRAMGMGGCQGTSTQLTIETDRFFGGEIE